MEKIFKHGGLEAPFDGSDLRTVEAFEEGMQKAMAAFEASKKAEKVSCAIRIQIDAICDLLDTLFGEDAGNRALGATTSLDEALEALYALTAFAQAQQEARNARLSQFAPQRPRRSAAQ